MNYGLRELRIVADTLEDELEVLSNDEVDDGPGFVWTSAERSRIMVSYKASSMTESKLSLVITPDVCYSCLSKQYQISRISSIQAF